jgi:hypothetical protein
MPSMPAYTPRRAEKRRRPLRPPFAVDDIVYKTPPAIPEPGTLLLVRSGIEGLLAARRRFLTF